MITDSLTDFSEFDRPEILNVFFHPRKENSTGMQMKNVTEILIHVKGGKVIGSKMHHVDKSAPTILFFHGNGEIVEDYDDLGLIYSNAKLNFFPVDYRGYGKSTGTPTISNMMQDCHLILDFVKQWLKENSYTGKLIVMGRSIGSASALELAGTCSDKFDGLIIESGFAYVIPLMRLFGIDVIGTGLSEEKGLRHIEKIKTFKKPTLIIHAQHDHIIPCSDGKALFKASQALNKTFLEIPNADHNSIFAYGIEKYMKAVKTLADSVQSQ